MDIAGFGTRTVASLPCRDNLNGSAETKPEVKQLLNAMAAGLTLPIPVSCLSLVFMCLPVWPTFVNISTRSFGSMWIICHVRVAHRAFSRKSRIAIERVKPDDRQLE